VFSLCFYTGCITGWLKVLTLSVLSVEENFKGGMTTKTSGNENKEGNPTISIVGFPVVNNTPLVAVNRCKDFLYVVTITSLLITHAGKPQR